MLISAMDDLEDTVKKYNDLNGELHLVELVKPDKELGLSLVGNKDLTEMSVFIVGIRSSSPAFEDGRLRIGDEILEVNDKVLFGRCHLNASPIIKSIQHNVRFLILRRPDNLKRMATTINCKVEYKNDPSTLIQIDKLNVEKIQLNKGPTGGLGFAIKQHLNAIYVRTITAGGVADLDKRLQIGDRILGVGGSSLINASYTEALEILRGQGEGLVELEIRRQRKRSVISEETTTPILNDHNNKTTTADKQLLLTSSTTTTAAHPKLENISSSNSKKTTTSNKVVVIKDDKETEEKLLKQTIESGKEVEIMIKKGDTGIGLSIIGGTDTLLDRILIDEIHKDGAAHTDGRLAIGDEIRQVDDTPLATYTNQDALTAIRRSKSLKLKVYRSDQIDYEKHSITLVKKPNKGLGLSIVAKHHQPGIYVCKIVKGGTADNDARIFTGDRIFQVNDIDMTSMEYEEAATILKTIMGKVTFVIGRKNRRMSVVSGKSVF